MKKSNRTKINRPITWRNRRIMIDQLEVPSYGYQRKPNKQRIEDIVKHYEPAGMRPLCVNYRDGKYQIMDGQHRYLAAKAINPTGFLSCDVIEPKLSYKQEAHFFNLYNGKSATNNSMEKFNARYESGEQLAKDIVNTVNSVKGLHVDLHEERAKGAMTNISPMEYIYVNFGPDYLTQVLNYIKYGFGLDKDSYYSQRSSVFKGLARFLMVMECEKYSVNYDILKKAMSHITNKKFYLKVKELSAGLTGSDAMNTVAMELYGSIYNKELQNEGVSALKYAHIPAKFSNVNDKDFVKAVSQKDQTKG